MRYMETINEIQVLFTKLRREIQRSKAPKLGKLPCHHSLWTCPICHAKEYAKYMVPGCICYPKIPGSHKDCPVHKTAGKCTCIKKDEVDIDCPEHGSRSLDESIKDYILTPDPLHVRVAKALGRKVYNDDDGLGWQMEWGDRRASYTCPVSNFPNDLVAAMGALEEYQKKHGLVGEAIIDGCGAWFFRLTDDFAKLYTTRGYSAKTLPQAICEAIVAHAEEK